MQIETDGKGYVTSYSFGGILGNGFDVEEPEDTEFFEDNYESFRAENGKLVFDKVKNKEVEAEHQKDEIRRHREEICFPVINRGEAWYRTLSDKQKEELQDWYQKWLDATETLIEPETPTWLKG